MKIGFVTSEEDPNLVKDDRLAIPFLKKHGYSVSPLVWDHISDVSQFDALIFRSCWNYHRKFTAFQIWLQELRQLKIPIFNSLNTIAWNLNKKHIIEFENTFAVPKTKLVERHASFSPQNLEEIFDLWKVDQLVIKPAVSLNGHDTYLLNKSESVKIEKLILDLTQDRDLLIQEFIPEIRTKGEVSLVFFNKKFNHAVRKVPAKNEFRVHSEYGGTRTSTITSPEATAYATALLKQIPDNLLFARVDIVEAKKGPILIELELTDPTLYLATSDGAAKQFASAILDVLS